MTGRVESGQLVMVVPIADHGMLRVGDIALCNVKGLQCLHLVKRIANGRFQIGNNKGRGKGWTHARAIYGRCIRVYGD